MNTLSRTYFFVKHGLSKIFFLRYFYSKIKIKFDIYVQNLIDKSISSKIRLNQNGQPNITELNLILRDMKAIRLNIKNFGYQLARDLTKSTLSTGEILYFEVVNLKSKPSTQEDIESKWLKYWCQQLKINPIYHRKIWELCYIPQAVYEHFETDKKLTGIGFGCGQEPLPSLFAAMGWNVTVTDLHPERAMGMGWIETGQYTDTLSQVFYSDIVDRQKFEQNVSLKYIDMNDISDDLKDSFNFCWSVCALEHLGSIQKGLDFIENSLKVLKVGGIAVHTTEYNYTNEPEIIDNWQTVIFQRNHFEELTKRLISKGYNVETLDFNVGNKPLDKFIDIPPFSVGEGWISRDNWNKNNEDVGVHLKINIDGYPCTCFGLIIKKMK